MDTLRISTLDEFVGQGKVIERLKTHIDAVNARLVDKKPLDHVLLAGRPGFGKTTLSTIIADLLGADIESLIMPVSEKTLQGVVRTFDGVLVLDEIHAASDKEQELLLPLLEFGYMQTKSGARIEAGYLTIIGCTTEAENVIKPLRDRFKIKPTFEDYSDEDMGRIVLNMAAKAGLEITTEDAVILGRATGGTPRNAADLVIAGMALQITQGSATADSILEFCDVDKDGLTRDHMRYLETLSALGGTKGLKQIATVLRESEAVCRELEMLLFDKGMIQFGTAGRELTRAGYTKVKDQ